MSDEQAPRVPTDDELRVAMFQTMEQMFLHSQANTNFIGEVSARVQGALAGNSAVAEVVDENEDQATISRNLAIQKEIISHLYEKSHQYVTVVIAGAYAAYFTTLGTLANRFSDVELRWSALLMTISLTVFVLWEVLGIFFIGHHTFKGDYGLLTESPKWMKRGWYAVMIATLATAMPAIGLSLHVYLRGLGAYSTLQEFLRIWTT